MTVMSGGVDHYLLVELNLPCNNASNWMTMYKYVNLYMYVDV
jgi:hypothetical protein